MKKQGLVFTESSISYIKDTIESDPQISRRKLSQLICLKNNWCSPNGNLKEMSCRKALIDLNKSGVIDLPLSQNTYAFNKPSESVMCIDIPTINCSLDKLGSITIQPIMNRYQEESKIWWSFIKTYHYLGVKSLCGAQIRYLIISEKFGPIGALAFTSASFSLAARDKFIGWSEHAKRTNLDKIICNNRFLILPTVNVPNLASYVLSLSLKRLPIDWKERYFKQPVLVETFVDPTRFTGTCYKSANWTYIGDSSGRRDGIPKKIFTLSLHSDWKKILCDAPEPKIEMFPKIENPNSWAENEFGSVRFYDPRLKQRLYTIAEDFYNNSERNIPEACGSRAKTIGAYRFFKNEATSMDVLLTPHKEATIERIKKHSVVLAPQDTTTLDYTNHPMTQGLGQTCHIVNGCIGLMLHDTIAFSEAGTPLGVLDAQCWARDPEVRHKGDLRKKLPIEKKESMKWLRSFQKVAEIQKLCPDTMLVSIGDRESDVYELFEEATKDPNGPKLLIRSEKTRLRKVEETYLWDYLSQCKKETDLKIHIPRSGSRKERDAIAEIRFSQVTLKSPKRRAKRPPITLWAVYICEKPDDLEAFSKNNPHHKPIEWMLLTTVPVKTVKDAKTAVEWYAGRWGIEVYHRTLKSGCRIRDRQFGSVDSLESCLGIDMVVAWRIYHLTMLGRETPNVACSEFFKEVEWKALYCYANKTSVAPKTPPTLREAVYMVGKIGGFLDRKKDKLPGTQVLWRGLQKLGVAAEVYSLLTDKRSASP